MQTQNTLLIIDDMQTNIYTLMELLDERYDILASLDGKSALELLSEERVDLILLDVMMPDMDGFEVCKELKSNPKTKDIPVIFITANSNESAIERAYQAGGVDYITRPFKAKEILSRINAHITLTKQKQHLQHLVEEKTLKLQKISQEIEATKQEITFTIGALGEPKITAMGNHVKRVVEYSRLLAKYAGLKESEIALLTEASPMHDIGKVALCDSVLQKEEKLTPEEYDIIKMHTKIGHKMLSHSDNPLFKMAATIALEHHEKWDGTGYPYGLKEEEISMEGRITAIADVFDALGSKRVYKKPWSNEDILDYMKKQSGREFDPTLIDILFTHIDEFLKIKEEFAN